MNNISQNFNINYRPAFKSAQSSAFSGDKETILVDRLEKKIDRNFAVQSETKKGLFHGGLLATLVCGLLTLSDMTISGTFKAINKDIKIKDIINPRKSMSSFGKKAIGILGILIFTQSFVMGILKDRMPSESNVKAKI